MIEKDDMKTYQKFTDFRKAVDDVLDDAQLALAVVAMRHNLNPSTGLYDRPVKELASVLNVSRPVAQRLVDRLLKDGYCWLAGAATESDRRPINHSGKQATRQVFPWKCDKPLCFLESSWSNSQLTQSSGVNSITYSHSPIPLSVRVDLSSLIEWVYPSSVLNSQPPESLSQPPSWAVARQIILAGGRLKALESELADLKRRHQPWATPCQQKDYEVTQTKAYLADLTEWAGQISQQGSAA